MMCPLRSTSEKIVQCTPGACELAITVGNNPYNAQSNTKCAFALLGEACKQVLSANNLEFKK